MPLPDVGPVLREHFVALAADADAPEAPVVELAQNLPNAMMLPFVLFADADGAFLDGSSGLVDPDRFARVIRSLAEGHKPGPPAADGSG